LNLKEPYIVAVVGKGGSGKSIFCAISVMIIAKMKKYKLLVVDADPTHPHLSNLLHVKVNKSLEAIRKEIIKTAVRGKEIEKSKFAEDIDYMVYNAIVENKEFSLLAIGLPEGPGCFCPANSLLKKVISSISKDFNIVIIDCEAGLEQMSREVISNVDTIVIISDISVRSIETAKTLLQNSKKFTRYKHIGIIINRVRGNISFLRKKIKDMNIPIFGEIPEDENVLKLDIEGKPMRNLSIDTQIYKNIERIMKNILMYID
jgi:CO dehydrogenase maturation factor